MSFDFNGAIIESSDFNGVDLTKITFNGTVIWEKEVGLDIISSGDYSLLLSRVSGKSSCVNATSNAYLTNFFMQSTDASYTETGEDVIALDAYHELRNGGSTAYTFDVSKYDTIAISGTIFLDASTYDSDSGGLLIWLGSGNAWTAGESIKINAYAGQTSEQEFSYIMDISKKSSVTITLIADYELSYSDIGDDDYLDSFRLKIQQLKFYNRPVATSPYYAIKDNASVDTSVAISTSVSATYGSAVKSSGICSYTCTGEDVDGYDTVQMKIYLIRRPGSNYSGNTFIFDNKDLKYSKVNFSYTFKGYNNYNSFDYNNSYIRVIGEYESYGDSSTGYGGKNVKLVPSSSTQTASIDITNVSRITQIYADLNYEKYSSEFAIHDVWLS